jgi:L-fucose isomerase-like protein
MENIPVIKLGLVAVSRDCFPINLSEKRRAAIAGILVDMNTILKSDDPSNVTTDHLIKIN